MVTQDILENPFCIVPAGGQCITQPRDSWGNESSNTYVFTIPYNLNNSFSYLAIHMRPQQTLGEGWAAAIYGRAVKGRRISLSVKITF